MRAASCLVRRRFNLPVVSAPRLGRTRHFSADTTKGRTAVHFVGDDRYGSREYVLLPIELTVNQMNSDPELKIASIHAHRNIMFGARVLQDDWGSMIDLCGPLLDAALDDAAEPGEQPQAMSSLAGLCVWVDQCIQGKEESEVLTTLSNSKNDQVYEAVTAIATGIPRPGHSVVGVGTYRDGKTGWVNLAKEFAQLRKSDEVCLYESRGGSLVGIEHLADQSEEYLRSAGGAMARLFFL